MKHYGLKPKKYDPRDKHFESHKILGSINPLALPDEYDADNGVTMPDQNADGAYFECSAYTVTDMAFDEDGQEYSPDYNFMKSLQIAGLPPDNQGVDLKSAFKVACTFGLLPKKLALFDTNAFGETYAADQKHWPLEVDKEAVKNIKPAYLGISGPYDFFDNVRAAMYISRSEKRTVGIGVTWYGDFETTGSSGLCPDNPAMAGGGHSPKISGWTRKNTQGEFIRGGEIFLKVKSWQGRNVGDNGWLYFSRPLINKLMAEWGADARMLKKLADGTVEELKERKVTFLEVLQAFIKNLVIALTH